MKKILYHRLNITDNDVSIRGKNVNIFTSVLTEKKNEYKIV